MAEEYIRIGKILNTQGSRGALRVLPLTDYPERFQKMARVQVLINDALRELSIEDTHFHKKYIIIKFKDIQDMNAAGELKGGFLVVTRDELVPLPEGSFYIFDLIGLEVFDSDGERLGIIADIIQTGSNDVYVVETEAARPLLVPALKQVVQKVDLKGRRMVVQLPEGLGD
ncbi:ribosome maturation factor RimM [Pelotomaculum terephthalicicum JT]|uniref:ribosome maturation factor RimM n=1 Tax=Pelotomaculum TaxID=191373 RepID=UPI0009C740B0|nr:MULTISPECIES: ribosome maturation factor RimM [Pelotomaculum]MCG9968189.1 ribosome maturation factor RimM [Pelotomaculum terephthalicicum JT]OPX83916.1 MAG: Ribosome maturation factor RimM [Pelotomaculum sp. PtaB.Bin117]OPY63208.1 MAG: Ribosome maturation factor RimM [Pelotomaculum sp. PtaU1.Bin065]